jgi:hypothetical protein
MPQGMMMGFEPGATKFKDVKLPRIKVGVRVVEPQPDPQAQAKAIAALQADLARVKRALAKVQEKLRDQSFARALAVEVDRTALQRMLDEVAAETGVTAKRVTGMQRSPGPLAAARLAFCLRAKEAGFTDRQIGLFLNGRSPAAISTFLKRARDAKGA